jgi:hypothetical protein
MCPGTRAERPRQALVTPHAFCPANGIERALTAAMRIIVILLMLVVSAVACAALVSAPKASTGIGQGSHAAPLDLPHAPSVGGPRNTALTFAERRFDLAADDAVEPNRSSMTPGTPPTSMPKLSSATLTVHQSSRRCHRGDTGALFTSTMLPVWNPATR